MNDGQIVCYLRKINPYVFEELVLYALMKKGYSVKRNAKYSNDGGIDGKVLIDKRWCYIQCKRYKNYINLKHVNDFSTLCREMRVKGYFIHTGKTGRGSKMAVNETDYVEIINGLGLLKLLWKNGTK